MKKEPDKEIDKMVRDFTKIIPRPKSEVRSRLLEYRNTILEEEKKEDKKNIKSQTIINALIERFDDLEEETGKDFAFTKRIILRWARKYKIFNPII